MAALNHYLRRRAVTVEETEKKHNIPIADFPAGVDEFDAFYR